MTASRKFLLDWYLEHLGPLRMGAVPTLTPGEARRLWVAALRSGEYKQGRGSLRPGADDYCCLGVLCSLAVEHGIIDGYNPDDSDLRPYPQVRDWVMIRCPEGGTYHDDVPSRHHVPSLAALNDSGRTFAEIADRIERDQGVYFAPEA